jgi:Ran GTPase-activating protein (RanGAP) involved in mRNA processing and transport
VELDLSENEIGPAGALALARAIKDSNNIITLVLVDCKLKAKGIHSLDISMEFVSYLKRFQIKQNIDIICAFDTKQNKIELNE